ncbi:MAG: fused MFS/spermidine synthase [Pseudomonadota bacterium]
MTPKLRSNAVSAMGLCLLTVCALPARGAGELVVSKESLYNNIFIYRSADYVTMTFGHNDRIYTESQINLADLSELPVTYTRFMTAALAYPRKLKLVAMVGLGGGRTSQYLHRFLPDASFRVSELDPDVVTFARRYFKLLEDRRYQVFTLDGRLFLRRQQALFDLILIDAYRGPFVPFHLLTREFYELAESRLAAGGAVAQNVEPSTMLFDSAVATMRAVFDQVDMYPSGGNVVLIAYNGEPRKPEALSRTAAARQQRFGFRYDLRALAQGRRRLTSPLEGKVLTDDFAPANMLKAIEQRNRKWE